MNAGRDSDFEKAAAGDWAGLISAGIAKAILNGSGKYCRQSVPPEYIAAYRPLLDHAQAVLVNRLASQNEDASAAGPFRRSLSTAQMLAPTPCGSMTWSARAGSAFADGRLDDVGYRLDARVSHLLLDEFQDTSLPQWWWSGPFARQVTAAGSGGRCFASAT